MKTEAEYTKDFEILCGSLDRAHRLFQLYKNSHNTGTSYDLLQGRGRTKEQVFIKRATKEGFTIEQIEALLYLQ
jgi:hypothetical protein